MHTQTLPAPRTLIEFTFLVVAFFALVFTVMLRITPYTGFNLIPATDYEDKYNSLVVSRTDDWVAKAGLAAGDRVNAKDALNVLANVAKKAFESPTIVFASTLAQGFEALETSRFDIALLDIGLPDGNGIELVKKKFKRDTCNVIGCRNNFR